MPRNVEPETALQEAEAVLKRAAVAILSDLHDLPVWKRRKGTRIEDRTNSGKPLFVAFKGEGTTVAVYLGAKERRCEVCELRLVDSNKDGLWNADNEYRLAGALRSAIQGPHGGEVLNVIQQI